MKKKIVLFGVLILLIALFPAVAQVCSPVDATISADFAKDGAGNFCWESTCLGDYVNSWNMTTLTINGVDCTNKYVASSGYPAAVNGKYYIVYKASYAWSHFEAKGSCASVPTDPPTTPAPTTAPTNPPTVTAIPGVGDVSMSPSSVSANPGGSFSFNILVNSGSQRVAAYGMDITYDAGILTANDAIEGADGFVSAVNLNNPGVITASGFDASGTGPNANLHLLTIQMTANNSGTSSIGISVDQLVDESTNTIGSPRGVGGTVTVGTTTAAPTTAPTAPPTVTAVPGVGNVSMSPSTVDASIGDSVSFSIMVNSGSQRVAAYGMDITYNSNILGSPAVDDGADGFVSAVNTNTAGTIIASGFDASGTGPGGSLELLIVSFAANASGTSSIGITVNKLVDENTTTIGNPNGVGGSVVVTGTITAAPTTAPTTPPIVTAVPGVGNVSMSPSTVNANIGDSVSFSVMVNSGSQRVAAYGMDITYNSNILGSPAVDDGADGFVSAVNTNTAGKIIASGFDASGTGPGGSLELLIVSFAANASGTSSIGITVNQLVDENTTTIGNPNGIGGSVVVTGTITAAPTTPPVVTDAPTTAPTTPPTTGCTCDSNCGSIVNITSSFAQNGSGTFCWQAPCLGSYINSWNLTKLEINGVDFTNKYASSSQYPAAIDGVYYIYFAGSYAWSHFEMNGTCSGTVTTAPTDPPVVTTVPTAAPTAVPTTVPTDPPVITPVPGVGNVSMVPSSVNGNVGDAVSFAIHVNSGTSRVAAYGMDITYSSNILGSPAVDDGADGFVSAVNTNTAGKIIASGFDATGTGPGSNLQLLIVTFDALASGNSPIGIVVNKLVDESTTTIGVPNGIGGTVSIETTITTAPTAVPTDPPVVTSVPGVGNVSMVPSSVSGNVGDAVSFAIHVNSGTARVAAYGMDITYSSNILGSPAVDDGADGFVSAVNTNTAGKIIASGFDANGTGPGSNLQFLIVTFNALASGNSPIGIVVNQLVDESTTTIGVPNGIGGTVSIETTVTTVPTAAPTTAPTDPPVTPVPGVGNVSMVPSSVSGNVGDAVSFAIHVNSGTSRVAAYGMDITYNSDILGSPAVDDGADGFVSAVNTNTAGKIIASGFDASGTGPGANLQLLIVSFNALASGNSPIGIVVNKLVDESTTIIGVPNGIGGTVSIETTITTAPTAAPTVAPTDPPVTPVPGVGNVSMVPSSVSGNVGDAVSFAIHVNSGTSRVAAYGMDITYSSNILGSPAVDDGADGFVSAVNTNTEGKIIASGFDASGTGPGSNLQLLIVSFNALASGNSPIGIVVNKLVDESTTIIGVPNGIGGTVSIATTITTAPTDAPTAAPTTAPTDAPTAAPTTAPTDAPTAAPTTAPTDAPTTAPTAVPTTPPIVKSAGSVWLDPSSQTVNNGAAFTLNVHCHTGNAYLAAYGIDFYFDTAVIDVDPNASRKVEKGPDGYLAASNTNTPGKIVTSGFDASGVGPSSDIHLLIIHMVGTGSGTSAVDIDVRSFVDDATTVIGTPNGIAGSVTVN